MKWVGLGVVATKLASLAAQFALGWYLSKDDFAVYAVAISVTSLATVLRDGGATKLLVQRGREYGDLAKAVWVLALCSNLVAGLILAAAAPLIAHIFGHPILVVLILILATAIPLSTAPAVHKAKLTAELRFRETTIIGIISSIVKNSALVAFAASGFGPLSFVLPQLIVVIVEWVGYRMAAGAIPDGKPLRLAMFMDLIRSTKWIMFAGLATALIANGDYLIVARVAPDALGVYFFGFQLAGAIMVLFTHSLQSVMMPTFSRIAGDRRRLAAAFVRSVTVLAAAGAYTSAAIVLAAPPVVQMLWQGKWDAAIPVVQFIGLTFAFRLLSPVSGAILESMGRWRLRSILIWIDGILVVVAAMIGCLWGTPAAVAAAVCIERLIIGVIATVAATAVLNQPIMKPIVRSMVGALLIGVLTISLYIMVSDHGWASPITFACYLIALAPVVILMAKFGSRSARV